MMHDPDPDEPDEFAARLRAQATRRTADPLANGNSRVSVEQWLVLPASQSRWRRAARTLWDMAVAASAGLRGLGGGMGRHLDAAAVHRASSANLASFTKL